MPHCLSVPLRVSGLLGAHNVLGNLHILHDCPLVLFTLDKASKSARLAKQPPARWPLPRASSCGGQQISGLPCTHCRVPC